MSGPQFFETGMGRKFYEGTLPKIAKALERIAAALERLSPPPPPPPPGGPTGDPACPTK
jgi:hypothetical protein